MIRKNISLERDSTKKHLSRLREHQIPIIQPEEEYFCTLEQDKHLQNYQVIYKSSDVIVLYCKKNKRPITIPVKNIETNTNDRRPNYIFFKTHSDKEQSLIDWRSIENIETTTEYFVYYCMDNSYKEYRLIYKDNILGILLDNRNSINLISCYELERESTIYNGVFTKIKIYKVENTNFSDQLDNTKNIYGYKIEDIVPSCIYSVIFKKGPVSKEYIIIYRNHNMTVIIGRESLDIIVIPKREFVKGKKISRLNMNIVGINKLQDNNLLFDFEKRLDGKTEEVDINKVPYIISEKKYMIKTEAEKLYKVLFKNTNIVILIDQEGNSMAICTEDFIYGKIKDTVQDKFVSFKLFMVSGMEYGFMSSLNEKNEISKKLVTEIKDLDLEKEDKLKSSSSVISTSLQINTTRKIKPQCLSDSKKSIENNEKNNLVHIEEYGRLMQLNITPKSKYIVQLAYDKTEEYYIIIYRDKFRTVLVHENGIKHLIMPSEKFNKEFFTSDKKVYFFTTYIERKKYNKFKLNCDTKKGLSRVINKNVPSIEPIEYVSLMFEGLKEEYKIIFKDSESVILLSEQKNQCIFCKVSEFKMGYISRAGVNKRFKLNGYMYLLNDMSKENFKMDSNCKNEGEIRSLQGENKNAKKEFISASDIESLFKGSVENEGKEIKTKINIDTKNMTIVNSKDINYIRPSEQYVISGSNVNYKIIYRDELITVVLGEDNKAITIDNAKFNESKYDFLGKDLKLYRIESETNDSRVQMKEDKDSSVRSNEILEDTFDNIVKDLFNNLDNLV
ncbi:hypothetical protein P8V03_15050 [Clostridium sp. A1-XYC3]|uniref:Cleavage/polyadenylation specificity factor A subunit C-terminal domain-containing protein n=1 Tax=Clostridium tanneri TaxID=3037988 RepID=A0ABU4JWD4_9CLOT|nr:hypothetical protein [Clostridium sp. A1-XYC3]MDW8802465.1 hypothetical protein [Clostridium sp. A1-XYC3]